MKKTTILILAALLMAGCGDSGEDTTPTPDPVPVPDHVQPDLPRFVVNDDWTVTDNLTGLLWERGPGDVMRYDDAQAYCYSLGDGWRMPEGFELWSLADDSLGTRFSPSISGAFQTGDGYYLSYTYGFCVGFEYPASQAYISQPEPWRIMCVKTLPEGNR